MMAIVAVIGALSGVLVVAVLYGVYRSRQVATLRGQLEEARSERDKDRARRAKAEASVQGWQERCDDLESELSDAIEAGNERLAQAIAQGDAALAETRGFELDDERLEGALDELDERR